MTASPRSSLFQRLVGIVSNVVGLFTPSEPPPREDVDAQMARLIDEYNHTVDRLVAELEAGRATIGQFVGAMPSLIKEHQLAAAVIASGGEDRASPQVLALAQRNVSEQLAYFDQWKAELLQQAVEGKLPSTAYIANRAKMYGKAALTTAQQAQVEAQGLPDLPFYPGQATRCRVNCRCYWDIKPVNVERGDYDCFWQLGAAEHCTTCLARNRIARPLKVRGGEIVNPERYEASGLYA